MATRPSLPYYAPADTLPAPLPTVADILAPDTQSIHAFPNNDRRVVLVHDHFIVKYGPKVRLQEGENMLFVQQSTSMPVPTVYALFHDEESGFNFIVQEYVPGENLFSYWKTADQAAKEAICAQLRRHFDELRSLPSPGYYGGVWRQPILDYYFTGSWEPESPLPDAMTCDTEEQWVDEMVARASAVRPRGDDREEWQRRMFRAVLRGHPPVFTHADLDRSNIIVRSSDKTVVLIDWERSGWYPSCWEWCLATMLDSHKDDWPQYIPKFLPQEWPAEVGWMMIYRDWMMFDSIF
ncbi:kinase-like protein [Coniochaeta sp. PMI_546]|nr:kinase-like protein [Coniochaeta sp. PMI_546]